MNEIQKQLITEAHEAVSQGMPLSVPIEDIILEELVDDLRASERDILNMEYLLGKIYALHALPPESELVVHIRSRIEGNRQIVEKILVELERRRLLDKQPAEGE